LSVHERRLLLETLFLAKIYYNPLDELLMKYPKLGILGPSFVQNGDEIKSLDDNSIHSIKKQFWICLTPEPSLLLLFFSFNQDLSEQGVCYTMALPLI